MLKSPPPVVVAPAHDPQTARKLRRIRRMVRLMDQAVRLPGTSISVGLDSLVGLAPVVGDVATVAAALYVVKQAEQMGVGRSVLRRMYVNVAIDCVGGFLPVVGDLFDVGWKANTRNLRLLEESLGH